MIRKIYIDNKFIEYDLQFKNVKNINLRIKQDGSVCVSASRKVPLSLIDQFVGSKIDFIERALRNFSSGRANKNRYFTETELRRILEELCREIYPYYKKYGIKYPEIKFRKMVSCWGNCRPKKGVVTFNTNLVYAPLECVRYVVYHEFTHFLHPNHSREFYSELEKVCPEWKNCKSKLKTINIR